MMKPTYVTADFKHLPRIALDALGLKVTPHLRYDGTSIYDGIEIKGLEDMDDIVVSPAHAAAILIGMVVQRCDVFFVYEADSHSYAADLLLAGAEEGSIGDSGPHICTTPLAAIMEAYAHTLGQSG